MTLILSDTGRQFAGPQKIITIEQPPVREIYLSSNPITLPTTQPSSGNGQVHFTLLDSDIQRMSPMPSYYQLCPIIHVGGKVGVSGSTVSAYTYWNNSSGAVVSSTSSTMASGNNWTVSIVSSNAFNNPVKIGDTYEVRLYASQPDVQLDYYAITCYLARCSWGKNGQIIKDVIYDITTSSAHTCTLGRSPMGIGNAVYNSLALSGGSLQIPQTGFTTLPYMSISQPFQTSDSSSYGLITPYFGDAGLRNSVNFSSHATYHPYYQKNNYPHILSYKEVLR